MTHQLYSPRHLACMNSRASASCWLTSILIFLHSNMVCPRTKPLSCVYILRKRGRVGRLPLSLLLGGDALLGQTLLFTPVVASSCVAGVPAGWSHAAHAES